MSRFLNNKHNLASFNTFLLTGLFMVFSFVSFSQGWELYYGGNAEDFGQAILSTPDEGMMVAGFSESFGLDGDLDVYVLRTDVDGTRIWSKVYDEGFIEHGYDLIENQEGDYFVIGDIKSSQTTEFDAYLLKINANGQQIWSRSFGGDDMEQGFGGCSLTDGGCLIIGRTDDSNNSNGQQDILLIKVDEDGNEVWMKNYGGAHNDVGRAVLELTDGYLLMGNLGKDGSDPSDIVFIKVDTDGNVIWQNTYGTDEIDEGYDVLVSNDGNLVGIGHAGGNSDVFLFKTDTEGNELWSQTFGGTFGDEAYDLIETGKGDLVATGVTEVSPSNINIFLMSIDTDGNLNWINNDIGRSNYTDFGYGVTETKDGGYAIAGYNAAGLGNFNDISLIKTNANGDFYTNHIQGKIIIDENENCNFDFGEVGLNDWLLVAESDDLRFYGATDGDGNFDITVDTGTYELSILIKNDYWESCIEVFDNLVFDNPTAYDTLTRFFPVKKLVDCSLLDIDVSAPVAQNCSNIAYNISYCNNGTILEDDATVAIILDPSLTFTNASIPLLSQVDSLLTFAVDPIDINACDDFILTVSSDCNGLPLESYIVEAAIMPDSFCVVDNGWNGASIDVAGVCNADSIRFQIKNEGTGNSGPLNYIIIEDIIIQREEPYQLQIDEEIEIVVPNDGATYRIIAEQAPNHPGNKYPTIAIEGCDNGSGNYTTGFVTVFQENENEPTVAIDAQETVEEPINNIDIRGYPKGYPKDGKRLIPANTDIEYQILFHNNGMDTVRRVVIRDTLSSNLDFSTIRYGASSHEYDFQVYDSGILKFTFDKLNLLPNESGYVQFKIGQQANLPLDTEIKNSAAMYVGYEAPFETTEIIHHIGGEMVQDFIITDVETVLVPEIKVNAYPNPFTDSAVIEIEGKNYNDLILTIFDRSGKQIREVKSSGNQIEITRNNLPQGMYVFQLRANGTWVASGKLMVN